jgi:hypothetical protein
MSKMVSKVVMIACISFLIGASAVAAFDPFPQTANAEGFKEVRADNGMIV